MAIIALTYDGRSTFRVPNGGHITIGPGHVVGNFCLRPFIHELASADMGFVQPTFAFMDMSGDYWKYSSILGPMCLFPRSDQVCKRSRCSFTPDFIINTVIDYGTDFRIVFENNRTLAGRFSHTHVRYGVCIEAGLISIALKIYVFATFDGNEGYESAYYSLPIEEFLWRPAPRFRPDEIILEAEDVVCVTSLPDPLFVPDRSAIVLDQ